MQIKDLSIGDSAVVSGYEKGAREYKKKLLTMGVTKGTKITLTKVAPLGDPVEIEVRDYKLSLRKAEANIILLEDSNE